MARRNEKRIERAVCRHADALQVEHLKLNVLGRRGYPDRVFFVPGGSPLLIEFKEVGEEPRTLQQRTIKKLQSLGYDVHVVDSEQVGCSLINTRLQQQRNLMRLWRKTAKKGML